MILIVFFNEVKCNLTELTTRSRSFTGAVSGLLDMRIHVHQDSSCSWSTGHCSSFVGVFRSVGVFPERGDSLEAVSPPCPSLSFYCFISVTGACFFSFRVWAHGWVAWICQPWEQSPSRSWLPMDVSGTQPPLLVGFVWVLENLESPGILL